MVTNTAPKAPAAPRELTGSASERLLKAATELFYNEGINVVGIDRVIERAGVAKASLYSTYGSKEGLVRAYLEGRLEARKTAMNEVLSRFDTPRDRLLGVWDGMSELFARPYYRGCAFVNASADAQPGSAAAELGQQSRAWIHELFLGLATDVGVPDPQAFTKQLVLLYDGSLLAAMMDGDRNSAQTARAVTEQLLDAALSRTSKRR